MGVLDFLIDLLFGSKMQCPSCGTRGARKSGDRILCRNPVCPNFDSGIGSARPSATSRLRKLVTFTPVRPISIRYRNFKGEEKTFTADADDTVRKKNHIVAKVAPRGRRIALSRDRIQNLSEVEAVLPQRVEHGQDWPSRRERQVLGYHKKYKTTSPLYEKIRAKYPNW